MEKFDILSGPHSGGDAERRLRALRGELYSFNEEEYRGNLVAQGKSVAEINSMVVAEKEKIRRANEAAKGIAMEEEHQRSIELLEREAQRHMGGDQEKAA